MFPLARGRVFPLDGEADFEGTPPGCRHVGEDDHGVPVHNGAEERHFVGGRGVSYVLVF